MTKAQRIARRRFLRPPKALRQVAAEVHPIAVQSGDRAYQFQRLSDGSMIEIRVWPDAAVQLTAVDEQGRPLPRAQRLPKLKYRGPSS